MKSYINIETGEIEYMMSDSNDGLQMKTNGDPVMKLGDHVVLDVNSGEIHCEIPLGPGFRKEERK